jgi:simple sugar transport system permease protein
LAIEKRLVLASLLGLAAGLGAAAAIAAATPAGVTGFLDSIAKAVTRPATARSVLLLAAPITVSALGLALAYRARFITIASEGQLVAGSAAALWLTAYVVTDLDPALVKPLALALAGLVGLLVGLLVAWLRISLGVNEILSSLMLNYVIMYVVNHLVATSWRVGAFTITRSVPEPYRIGWAEALAAMLALTALYWVIVHRTVLGYEADALGQAPRAAVTYGVRSGRVLMAVSALQGIAGGVAGALMMLGFQHALTAMSVTPGYGYMGVLVAWLAGLEPLACLGAGLLYAMIGLAVRLLQAHGVGFGVALAMQAVILLAIVASTGWARVARR